mmetsp:Transcript_7671/g.27158  ORF Transcript_7671/g.27158 Transcript_7671/m.27158 type:complete len:234 (+) Transcript_7671:87-788(+)
MATRSTSRATAWCQRTARRRASSKASGACSTGLCTASSASTVKSSLGAAGNLGSLIAAAESSKRRSPRTADPSASWRSPFPARAMTGGGGFAWRRRTATFYKQRGPTSPAPLSRHKRRRSRRKWATCGARRYPARPASPATRLAALPSTTGLSTPATSQRADTPSSEKMRTAASSRPCAGSADAARKSCRPTRPRSSRRPTTGLSSVGFTRDGRSSCSGRAWATARGAGARRA